MAIEFILSTGIVKSSCHNQNYVTRQIVQKNDTINKITTYAHNIINHDIHTNYVHKPNKSAVIHQVIHIIHIFVNNKSGLHRFFSERMFWMCFTKNAFFRQRKIRSCIQNRLVDSLGGTRTKLLDFLQVLGYHEP